MYQQNATLFETNWTLTAQLDTTSAHSTLAQKALGQSCLELENVKKKEEPQKSVKLHAQFVTLPELEEDFNKVEVEHCEKEQAEAERQGKKKADDKACMAQIVHDIHRKTFHAPSIFCCKDDYMALAGALETICL
ncbi:hypothetical protein F5141DRAFT_1062099 [Pisolithus sp. B1]|nr:hypothetical protein F5141DRAFT_1062099 [Pisolithus sp. B1]